MERFTADQARAAMDGDRTSFFDRYMNTLYKQIELRAKNGFSCYICKTLHYPSKLKRVIDTLQEDGYKVQYDCMDDKMIVYW